MSPSLAKRSLRNSISYPSDCTALPFPAGMIWQLDTLRTSWDGFIATLLEEWRALNVVSALLSAAVLALLALDGALNEPVTRTAGILSLVCALWSIVYSSVYIIRFAQMSKRLRRAAGWAEAARNSKINSLWNVWVLLAMPIVWLMWSLISFMVAILSFVWIANAGSGAQSARVALGTRIAITCVVGLGGICFLATLNTLRHYGAEMDQKWKDKSLRPPAPHPTLDMRHFRPPTPLQPLAPLEPPVIPRSPQPSATRHVPTPRIPPDVFLPSPLVSSSPAYSPAKPVMDSFEAFRVIALDDIDASNKAGIPAELLNRGMRSTMAWERFIEDVRKAWLTGFCWDAYPPAKTNGVPSVWKIHREAVFQVCFAWTAGPFRHYNVQPVLCEERPDAGLDTLSIYLTDTAVDKSLDLSRSFHGLRDGVRMLRVHLYYLSLKGAPNLGTITRGEDGNIVYSYERDPTIDFYRRAEGSENVLDRGSTSLVRFFEWPSEMESDPDRRTSCSDPDALASPLLSTTTARTTKREHTTPRQETDTNLASTFIGARHPDRSSDSMAAVVERPAPADLPGGAVPWAVALKASYAPPGPMHGPIPYRIEKADESAGIRVDSGSRSTEQDGFGLSRAENDTADGGGSPGQPDARLPTHDTRRRINDKSSATATANHPRTTQ
ncbi:unnamed protein product [Peniophora sp. CBMAI 1063]|nr:unnamed protein product [Peniophora sp. CBMAI 1063]